MKKAIVGSTLAIALLVGGCTGGGDSPNKSPGIPNGQVIKREEPKEVKQEVVYTSKDVSEMSKEERYKEIVKTLDEAHNFYMENFFTNQELESKSEDWFDNKRQTFKINYLHKFHVLCAKELAESEPRKEIYIPKSKSGKPVWYIENALQGWANEMEPGGLEKHMLNTFSQYGN